MFSQAHSPSILYIDDDKELSSLIVEYLSREMYAVDVCFDGETGLAKALAHKHYDLILLDVMLPKLDGFEVLKAIRQTCHTPIILLTAKSDEFDRVFGLEIGADDYLPKPFSTRELLARIKAMLRRMQFNQQSAALADIALGPLLIDNKSLTVSFDEKFIKLTNTEFSVLQALAIQKGQKVSKSSISLKVFARSLEPFDRSIDMHISNIRRKLSKHTRVELIRTVRPQGYMLLDAWP